MTIQDFHFVPGELYLFSLDPRRHDPDRCLWGIFDKLENGNVVLEVMTDGLTRFYRDACVPPEYVSVRRATRNELKDFYFSYGHRSGRTGE